MINIVGDHASYHLSYDAPLTSDIESLARPMSQWVARVTGPDQVVSVVEDAYRASMMIPGVSTVILPADSAWGEASETAILPLTLPTKPVPSARDIQRAAVAIRTKRNRCGIILGGDGLLARSLEIAGQISASHDVRLFSPVLLSRTERGLGRVAVSRIPYPIDMALDLLKELDVVILLGTAAPVAFFGYPGKPSSLLPEGCEIVHLADLANNIPATLAALSDELGSKPLRIQMPSRTLSDEGTPKGTLTEDAIAVLVAQNMPENTILCDEALTSARRLFSLTEFAPPHDYLMNTGGSIGIGIPMALGAAVACPDRKVIALQADGSGMYTVQGLWTQARENLDILTIVLSNRAYAILIGEMTNVGVTAYGGNAEKMMQITNPELDWVALAKGMGVEGARATTCEEFSQLLKVGISRKGPFLIEAMI